MVAWRYEIYLLVFKSISSWTLEDKFHISAQPCIILYIYNKEIKNAPECIVELYKHAGIFKNTREVHREARGVADFSSVLKNSQVLI